MVLYYNLKVGRQPFIFFSMITLAICGEMPGGEMTGSARLSLVPGSLKA